MNRKKNLLLAGAILGIPLLATSGVMASIFNASPAHAAQTVVKGVTAPAADIPFDKGNFDDPLEITNPYMPLEPETTFSYEEISEGLATRSEFVVTEEVKTILGVDTRVVRDTAWEDGVLVELTYDWFAQDDAGNVWYFGEFATNYENGEPVDHEGSWQAGVNGARPGIVMLANPQVGDKYSQERAEGIAEDKAVVLSRTESICVPYGCFSNVLLTKDFTPLEPDFVEHKYYAPGVGHIKTIMVKGGEEESHLVEIVMDD